MSIAIRGNFSLADLAHFRDRAPPRKLVFADVSTSWKRGPKHASGQSSKLLAFARARLCVGCGETVNSGSQSDRCPPCRKRHARKGRTIAPKGVREDARNRRRHK